MKSFELPYPPSTNSLFRNVPGKGRVKTQRYLRWEVEAGWELKRQRVNAIPGPVHFSMIVERKGGRRDLDNTIKPVLDLLVSHQILADDSMKNVPLISVAASETAKGVMVMLTPANEEAA